MLAGLWNWLVSSQPFSSASRAATLRKLPGFDSGALCVMITSEPSWRSWMRLSIAIFSGKTQMQR